MLEATHMSAVDFSGISVEALQNGKYRYFEEVLGLPIAYNHHVAVPAPVSYTHLDVYKRQGYLLPKWRNQATKLQTAAL